MYKSYVSKYLDVSLSTASKYSVFEYRPFFYIDFWKTSANLVKNFFSSNTFAFILGGFDYELFLVLKWGHAERPKNEIELERERVFDKHLKELLEGLKNDPKNFLGD